MPPAPAPTPPAPAPQPPAGGPATEPATVAMVTASVSRANGGLAPIVLSLAAALREGGRAVDVLSVRDEFFDEDAAAAARQFPSVGGGPPAGEAFEAVGPRFLQTALRLAPGLTRALRDRDPAVVHTHGLWHGTSRSVLKWGDGAAAGRPRPRVVSPQGMLDGWALSRSRWKKRLAGAWFERRHVRGAACVHALAENELDAARRFGARGPVCVIPNGVPLDAPRPDVPPPWRERPDGSAGPDDGRRTLLFLGRIHPKKGVDLLLDAWAAVLKAEPAARDWRLAVVGWDDGGHAAGLERRAAALDLGEAVAFCGPAFGDRKAAALARADAFVLPTHSEGMPVAVLEAWSYGLPTVLTPGCNLPAGYDRGGAIRVEPDAADLARGLAELVTEDPAARRARGAAARRLAEAEYGWPTVAAQFGDVYDWLAARRDRPACVVD